MKVISDVRCAVCKRPPMRVVVKDDFANDCSVYHIECHGQRDMVCVPNRSMTAARASGALFRVHAFTGRNNGSD